MSQPYFLQRLAQEDDDLKAILKTLVHEVAANSGKLERLLHQKLTPAAAGMDPALPGLIDAAYGCLGSITWVTTDLFREQVPSTPQGIALATAMAATGKTTPRSLGKYLARNVGAQGCTTESGLVILRITKYENMLNYSIKRV